MEVQNAVIPTAEQMEGFLSPDADAPIFMVNLLKYRERAEYEDWRGSELTGREAYQIYATGVAASSEKSAVSFALAPMWHG